MSFTVPTPIMPTEPSTPETTANPSSLTNLTKQIDEQKKQAESDKKYDTKGSLYETFQDLPSGQKVLSIAASFTVAAGILLIVGGLLPKSRRR